MNEPRMRAYRVLLRCYPKSFLREYEGQMLQAYADRVQHDGTSSRRILLREISDAAIAATAMRWENMMTRVVTIAVVFSLALLAALAAGPLPAIGILLVVALIAFGRARSQRPIDGAGTWMKWVAFGAVALIPAVAILATSDEELSEILWSLMALSMLTGLTLLTTGLVVALSQRPTHSS
jgi:hypothetical protein